MLHAYEYGLYVIKAGHLNKNSGQYAGYAHCSKVWSRWEDEHYKMAQFVFVGRCLQMWYLLILSYHVLQVDIIAGPGWGRTDFISLCQCIFISINQKSKWDAVYASYAWPTQGKVYHKLGRGELKANWYFERFTRGRNKSFLLITSSQPTTERTSLGPLASFLELLVTAWWPIIDK